MKSVIRLKLKIEMCLVFESWHYHQRTEENNIIFNKKNID